MQDKNFVSFIYICCVVWFVLLKSYFCVVFCGLDFAFKLKFMYVVLKSAFSSR